MDSYATFLGVYGKTGTKLDILKRISIQGLEATTDSAGSDQEGPPEGPWPTYLVMHATWFVDVPLPQQRIFRASLLRVLSTCLFSYTSSIPSIFL